MSGTYETGQMVTGIYKTGKYVGEIIDVNRAKTSYVVKVLAVIKHPTQGDLHNPQSVNVPLFHERKALSYMEKANIPAPYIKPYDGEIPEYKKSLAEALSIQKDDLVKMNNEWADKSLESLRSLEKDYFK
jgi:kinase-associated protein B